MSSIQRNSQILYPLNIDLAEQELRRSLEAMYLSNVQTSPPPKFSSKRSASVPLLSYDTFDMDRRSSHPDAACSPPMPTTSRIWSFDATPQQHVDSKSELGGYSQSISQDSSLGIIEDWARRRRSCTSVASNGQTSVAKLSWEGNLSLKLNIDSASISRKVFVGGLCRDVDTDCLLRAFLRYSVESVEWCDKAEKGFAYIIFATELKVRELLATCTRDVQNRYYYKIGTTRPHRDRKVQLIPWIVDDADISRANLPAYNRLNSFLRPLSPKPRPQITENTVFVGALHGEMTACDLAIVMEELFGAVLSVGLDTDKFRYPVGTARVTFYSRESYTRAIETEYIAVNSNKFRKTLQVDPYLRDVVCSKCLQAPGPVFCRSAKCFNYFCGVCYFAHLQADTFNSFRRPGLNSLSEHVPLMRNRAKKNFCLRK